MRKIAVFRLALATKYNELKKNILNNVCKVIKLGLCQKYVDAKQSNGFSSFRIICFSTGTMVQNELRNVK